MDEKQKEEIPGTMWSIEGRAAGTETQVVGPAGEWWDRGAGCQLTAQAKALLPRTQTPCFLLPLSGLLQFCGCKKERGGRYARWVPEPPAPSPTLAVSAVHNLQRPFLSF